MKVYFVGAGPGNPELLTLKAHRLITSCKCCIYAGSLVSPDVINLIPAGAEKHDSAVLALPQIMKIIESAIQRDVDVVRLHSGEPAIYGSIGEQISELKKAGVDFEVVPGISAFQAAAAALRKELTMPNVSQAVILTRAGGKTPVPESQTPEKLAAAGATMCIYLSTNRVEEIAGELAKSYGADCPAAVVYHASWPDEKIIYGALANIAGKVKAEGISKTALILVGPALGEENQRSLLYDQEFSHGFRKGKKH